MKEEIITKMSKFTITEQAILLITRKDLNEEQMNYLREILNSCEMDWSYFVGSLIYNRVNGIAYKNLVKMGGVTRRIMFPLEAAYENIKKRTNLHCSEILKLDKYFEEAGINYAFLKGAVLNTMYYEFGERLSNDTDLLVDEKDLKKVDEILKKRLNGESISREEEMIFKTAFMQFVGKEYQKKNWVMQIHYGCKRDNNAFMYEQLGPDTGYDCINNYAPSAQTADFLNSLIASNELPKTILYSLNPNDNEAIGTILGCFQGTEAAGKIQQGSAWWFNDHKTGMIAQMTSLANLGLLANFVGMLTDSRSFLSYTRHEYFRRILCELIGGWVENGEYPADYKTLKEIVCGISYNNAVDYFGFDL